MSDNIEQFINELRQRWRQPGSLTYAEFRRLRQKFRVSLADCSDLLDIGTAAIFNAENADSYVDGGIATVLDRMFGDLVPETPPEPSPTTEKIEVEVEITPPAAPTKPPPLIDRVVARLDAFAKAKGTADLTWSQKALFAIDIYVEETGMTKFSTKHKAPGTRMETEIREAIHSYLGLDYVKQTGPAWLFYRHVKCGTRPLIAMMKVRSGQQAVTTALIEYDADAWNPTRARTMSTRERKSAERKKRKQSGDTSDEKPVEKPKRSGRSSGRHPTPRRGSKKRLEGAERTEAHVGSLLLHLRAIRAEFSGDSELLGLIEGITTSVEPMHLTLKQLVLKRATARKRRRPKTTNRETDHA